MAYGNADLGSTLKNSLPNFVNLSFNRELIVAATMPEIKNLHCAGLSDYDKLFKIEKNNKEIKISLSKSFDDLFQGKRLRTNDEKKDCLVESDQNFALRMSMKSVAVAWDGLGLRTKDDLEKTKRCLSLNRQRKISSDECAYYLSDVHGQTSFSNRGYFKNLLGWFETSLNSESKNISPRRLPEKDLYVNKGHAFATHFSFYMVDKDYACRFPLMNDYFNLITNQTKISHCALNTKIRKHGGKREFVDIAPDKVKRIDYFLASPGEDMSSGQGHAMLRLVLCPEGFEPEDYGLQNEAEIVNFCAADVRDDLIVSFRASVDDIKLSYMKGFFGGYPSVMFMMDPFKVIQEYVQKEMRNLYSIPIKLTDEEKKRLSLKILEDYWTYQGDYKFLTSNCATETRDLLRSAIQSPWYAMQGSIKPLSIATDLETSNRLHFKFLECDWTDTVCLKKFSHLKDVPSLMVFAAETKKLIDLAKVVDPQIKDIKAFFAEWDFPKRKAAYIEQTEVFLSIKEGTTDETLKDLVPYVRKVLALRKKSYDLSKLLGSSFNFDMAQTEKIVKAKIETAKNAQKFQEKTKEYLVLASQANTLPTRGGYGIPFDNEIVDVDYGQIDKASQEVFMRSTEELMGADFINNNRVQALEMQKMSDDLVSINNEVLKLAISIKKKVLKAIKNEVVIDENIKDKATLIKFLNQQIDVEYFSMNNLSSKDVKDLAGFDP